jgi:iron-sulfur cluster assembly protein
MTTEEKPIILTEAAAKQIQKKLAQRGKGIGICVGVKTTGCSGLAYTLEYLDRLDENTLYWMGGNQYAKVVCSKKDFPYLTGMTVDYVRDGLNEGFKFINPNAKDECGCGESFRV